MKPIKKIFIALFAVMILSEILTMFFDDTNIEYIFRAMWISLMFICTILFGIWQLSVKQNKLAGYFYFILGFIFLATTLSIYYL